MTQSPEGEPEDGPVHYQVSITGRQAGLFFLAILAALGLAFFFGMKTGAASHRAPDPATRLAAASDLQVPTPVPDRDARGSAAASEPPERPLGFDAIPTAAATPPPAASPTHVPARSAQKTPAPHVAPTAPAAQAPATEAPAAAPVPVKPARPVEKAPAPAREGKVWVHAAALNAERADALVKKLKEKGYPTDLSPVAGKDDLFRIRIGPYSDRAKAEAVAKRLKAEKWQFKPEVRSVKP